MNALKNNYIIEKYYLKDNGIFPNSSLPVILYKNVLQLGILPFSTIRRLFRLNNWTNSWKNGIFNYHHYHSITHEVLGVYRGKTTLLLGGAEGVKIEIEKGDVLIIPAGVAHKNLESQDQIKCVGAYPQGKEYDMNYGRMEERPQTDRNIKKVPTPQKDPIFGLDGGIINYWK